MYQIELKAEFASLIESYLQLRFNQISIVDDYHISIHTNSIGFLNRLITLNQALLEAEQSNDYVIPADGLNDGGCEYTNEELKLIRFDQSMDHLRRVENEYNDPIDPNPEVKMDSNERLMNVIFPNAINECGNCRLCMNKSFNPFCIQKNSITKLDQSCNDWERMDD